MNKVVITGLGVVSPLGMSVKDFWRGLLAGRSGIKRITEFDLSRIKVKIGGMVKGYDPDEHYAKKEQRRISRSTQIALIAAAEAVQDAEIDLGEGDPYRKGVILGTSIAGFTSVEPFFEKYFLEDWEGHPFIIPKVMNNAPASNISIKYGLKGPLLTTDAACASAAHSVGYALHQIRSGGMDVALVGGADSGLSPAVMKAWTKLRVLSSRNDTPEQALRPFSADRDGMVLGEGAGILVLESEAHAKARGAQIYAEITGYGATSDGHHITQPSVDGPAAAIRIALGDAGLNSEDIDYVNAHATGTPWNDNNETTAIKQALGEHAYKIPVVGIKGAVGHSIAATGALELISVALTIKEGCLPPTINVFEPDPECDLDYVTDGPREAKIQHAVSNSFGFGGSNGVIAISKYS